MPVKEYIDNLSLRERAKTMAFEVTIMKFREHLNEEMKNAQFKKAFDEEKHLLELGLVITEAREQRGLSQRELAQKSHVTQQQLSKIENGINCNMLTFIKVSSALGLDLAVRP